MFNFFNELKDKCYELKGKITPYKLIEMGDFLVYFEGENKLITLSADEIVFKSKSDIISVVGKDLKIKSIQEDNITIIGKIKKIERLWYGYDWILYQKLKSWKNT